LSKKFELGKFKLVLISKTGSCHTCRTFAHALEVHARNHELVAKRDEWKSNWEELDPCIERRWKGE
jgi:hypothetical protein